MRVPGTWAFAQVPAQQTKEWLGRMLHEIGALWFYSQQAINGNITFGDLYDADNLKGKWISFTTSVTPDTEFSVAHDTGNVPIGFLDVGQKDKAGVLYKGTTAWTTSLMYLKCNVASVTFRIFVLLPPEPS